MKKAIVYTDGSYSGSTGKMGYGVHFEDGSGDLHGEIKTTVVARGTLLARPLRR